MKTFELLAWDGESRFLFQVDEKNAVVVDLGTDQIFPPQLPGSFLKTGYWLDPKEDKPSPMLLERAMVKTATEIGKFPDKFWR